MTTKITPDTFNKTLEFILCNHRRRLKAAVEQYQNKDSDHYGDYLFCQNRLSDELKTGKEQLQGLIFLFVDHPNLVQTIKTAQSICLEDWRLQHFMAFTKQNRTVLKPIDHTRNAGVSQNG